MWSENTTTIPEHTQQFGQPNVSIFLFQFSAFALNGLDGFVDWTKEVAAEFDAFETPNFRLWRDLKRIYIY